MMLWLWRVLNQQNPRLLEWSIAQQDSSLSSLSKKNPYVKPAYGGLSWSFRMKAKESAKKASKQTSLARQDRLS